MVRTRAPSKRPSRSFRERSRGPRWDALIAVLSAGLALIVTLFLFAPFRRASPSNRSSLSTATAPGPAVQSPTVQRTRHTNAAAGYSFLRPAGWDVSDRDTVSELAAPARDVILSFGLGSDGGLREASTEFVASIDRAYDDVQLQGTRRETIAGHSAIVVGGSALNRAAVGVRFLAISIRMAGRNYAISVFVADASDPLKVLPVVEDVIASFEVV